MIERAAIAGYAVGAAELQVLVTCMREGVIGLDGEGIVCLCNPAAAAMLDLDAAELFGRPFEQGVPHVELHRVVRLLRQHPDQRVSRQVAIHGPGDTSLLDLMVYATGQSNGRPITHLIFLNDVTDMARSTRVKADFVANASHELRTPLSTMQAAAETLLASSSDWNAHQRRFLEVINKNLERLKELARDLVELNRVESPALQVQRETVDLPPLLEDLRRDYAARLEERGSALHFDLEFTTLDTDAKLLKLMLTNLIDNAVKFVRPGTGRIEVRSRMRDRQACLEVRDNGIGIPDEDQERIFERFYQVDRARKETGASGTGLGLAIVKHAVAALGGGVELESVVDQGTLVRLRLPPGPSEA